MAFMARLAVLIFEGLVRDFIFEARAHLFMAIETRFAHAPAGGLGSGTVQDGKDQHAGKNKIENSTNFSVTFTSRQ